MNRRLVAHGLILALGVAGVMGPLAGCRSAGPRALQTVRESGDRAYLAGNFALAEEEYREVVSRAPDEKKYRKQYGMALLRNEKPALARENLEIAYTFQPRDAKVIEALAESMMRSGDVEGMARYLKGLAEERGAVADWMRLGQLMQLAGDADEAKRAYLIAARVDEGVSLEPQMALAELYRSVGDRENAIERARMAYYLKPKDRRVIDLVRSLDEIEGPTFAMRPMEQERREASAQAMP